MATTTIRTATPDDIKQIHRWLQEEERMGVQGNFLCNWEVISNQYEDQDVVVFIPKGDTVPRGFLTAGLSVSSILQVQSQFRGQGIARQLVEHALARCEKDNDFQLLLECAPITSIPFWQHMGFTRIGEGSYVYRLFDVTWPLKTETPKADVQIQFYPQARQYDDQTPPVCSFSPVAVWCDSGDVQLSQRASIFTPIYSSPGDVVIQISLDGDVLYINKAKYRMAILC